MCVELYFPPTEAAILPKHTYRTLAPFKTVLLKTMGFQCMHYGLGYVWNLFLGEPIENKAASHIGLKYLETSLFCLL